MSTAAPFVYCPPEIPTHLPVLPLGWMVEATNPPGGVTIKSSQSVKPIKGLCDDSIEKEWKFSWHTHNRRPWYQMYKPWKLFRVNIWSELKLMRTLELLCYSAWSPQFLQFPGDWIVGWSQRQRIAAGMPSLCLCWDIEITHPQLDRCFHRPMKLQMSAQWQLRCLGWRSCTRNGLRTSREVALSQHYREYELS